MIVRWGLERLGALLAEAGVERPLVVASPRWDGVGPEAAPRWREVPSDRVDAPPGVDGLLAVGGGSAIDTAKAVSAAAGLPLVSVPTTYAGAEWTPYFGVRDAGRRMRGGGSGARLAGVLYDPTLTLDLPRAETVGTALNALAHCAEALYAEGRNEAADEHALAGARLIAARLPEVVERPRDLAARTELLRGACHAGAALGGSMLALGHALAQALGGRYGLPHGAMNALCLPPALRFNAEVAPDAVARFAEAIGADDAAAGVERLAALAPFGRLRDFGVPREELPAVAAAAVTRRGAQANPRPASPDEALALLESIW